MQMYMKKKVVIIRLSVIHLRDRLLVSPTMHARVLREVLQLAPHLALERTCKHLWARGFPEPERLCFLIPARRSSTQ